jgi:hypothetical protein
MGALKEYVLWLDVGMYDSLSSQHGEGGHESGGDVSEAVDEGGAEEAFGGRRGRGDGATAQAGTRNIRERERERKRETGRDRERQTERDKRMHSHLIIKQLAEARKGNRYKVCCSGILQSIHVLSIHHTLLSSPPLHKH